MYQNHDGDKMKNEQTGEEDIVVIFVVCGVKACVQSLVVLTGE